VNLQPYTERFFPFDCENLHWTGKEREEKEKHSRGVKRERRKKTE